jgi:putative flippase GtrA
MRKKELFRKIKFTLFSISAGIIEIVLFTLLNELTKLPYGVCYFVALVASVIWNFTLNREFTFKSTANVPVAMFKVGFFYLVFTPVSTFVGDFLVGKGWNEYLVTGLNMLCNFFLEYLYDKYFVFRGTIDTKEKKEV